MAIQTSFAFLAPLFAAAFASSTMPRSTLPSGSCSASGNCSTVSLLQVKQRSTLRVRSNLHVHHEAMLRGHWDFPLHAKPGVAAVPEQDLELVVASNCEPGEWFLEHRGPIAVYNKGACRSELTQSLAGRASSRVIDLPNTGREGDTYLHHILQNYDHLAPYTVFAQGAGEHNGVRVMDKLKEFQSLGNRTAPIVPIVHRNEKGLILYRDADPGELISLDQDGLDDSNVYIFDYGNVPVADKARAMYMTMFGGTACEAPPMVFSAGAQFIVSREAIRARPRAFYEHLLSSLDNAQCAELGYVLERLWLFVFDPKIQGTTQLKEYPDYCAWQRTQERLKDGRGDCTEYRKSQAVQHFTDQM